MKKHLLTSLILGLSLFVPSIATQNVYATNGANFNQKTDYLNPSILDNFIPNSIYSNLVAEDKYKEILLNFEYIAKDLHYNHIDLKSDNEATSKALKYYLSKLDPDHIFFTKEDVDYFNRLYTTGSRPQFTNNLDVAYKIYQVYATRATQFNRDLVTKVLGMKKEPNLNTNRMISADGFDRDWPSANDYQDTLYNTILKRIIFFKNDRNITDWNKIRELVIRQSVHQQKNINHYDAQNVFKIFVSDGLAKALDTHSDYYPPANQNQFTDSLSSSFVGIGVVLKSSAEGLITFTSIIEGGPVSKQGGVEPDDALEAISHDGKKWINADELDLDSVIQNIKGKKGTPVWLKLLSKDGKTKVSKIIRGEVINELNTVKFTTYKVNGKEYGIASFGSFYQNLDNDLRRNLKAHPNLQGLIIDLRNNGGGLVNEVLGISDIFINTFSTVFQTTNSDTNQHGSPRQARPTSGEYLLKFNKPLIVMINGYSASASEIFSAAMQDYRRGIIVGSTSYGKGTVQAPYELSPFGNDGLFKATIQKFLRVNGRSTQFKGVTPDIELQSSINPNVRGFSERSSINPLSYTFITPAKYRVESQYVNSTFINDLEKVKQNYERKYPVYRAYEKFKKEGYDIMGERSFKLNYQYQHDRLEKRKEEHLSLYNRYAPIIGYPKLKTYKELTSLKAKDNKFDPDLDLVKQMLVVYAKDFNNQ